jgi:hypothetical protein
VHTGGLGWHGAPMLAVVLSSVAFIGSVIASAYGDAAPQAGKPALSVYPAPAGAPLSTTFAVAVSQTGLSQHAAPVFSGSSEQRCRQLAAAGAMPSACKALAGHTQSWASFWYSGVAVTVTVSRVGGWGDWSRVRLRSSFGHHTHHPLNATAFSFELPPSSLGWKVSVESEVQESSGPGLPVVQHMLMIFGDPEELAPDLVSSRQTPGMLYFAAGLHDLGGQMVLAPNISSVYIAGGAWVSGGFITQDSSSSVRITGRGVLSGSATPFLISPQGTGYCSYNGSFCWSMINLDKGTNHVVEGLVLHDPPKFYFRSEAPGVVVRGAKLLGAWPYNTDGVATGENGVVTDCFIRANDDTIKLYSSNMLVEDCTLWQGSNGACFQLGWWTSHSQRDILVQRVVVLHSDWRQPGSANDGVVDLRGPGKGGGTYHIQNITWNDVRLAAAIPGGALLRMNLDSASGSVSQLSFSRISMASLLPSTITEGSGRAFSNFSFTDLTVNGHCVRNINMSGLQPAGAFEKSGFTFDCTD